MKKYKIPSKLLVCVLLLGILIALTSFQVLAASTKRATGAIGGYTCNAVLSLKNSGKGAYASTSLGSVTNSIYTKVSYSYQYNGSVFTTSTHDTYQNVQSNIQTIPDMTGTYVSASSKHIISRSGYSDWSTTLSLP